MKNKKYTIIIMLLLVSISCFGTLGNIVGEKTHKNMYNTNNDTEYWALIVGVSKIEGIPEMDIPLKMNGQSADELKELLIKSENWKDDHIKILTGEEATTFEIMKGLRWLARNDDEDDICLFYMSSMGLQTSSDMFPRDEEDGMDECLLAYNTFKAIIPLPWIHLLYDDQINFFLNRLDAEGVCVIIESEYSGGFNDGYQALINHKILENTDVLRDITNRQYTENITQELKKQGRIVIATCEEYTHLNTNWILIHDIMSGLQGFADVNKDERVSIEEAFNYASPSFIEKCEREYKGSIRPQMFDNYEGELILTDVHLPPNKPFFEGPTMGYLNAENTFTILSNDPEQDRIRYYVDWGDGTEQWTDLYDSGEEISMSHIWSEKGTFTIYFECEDEYGNGLYEFPMMDRTIITIIEDEIIDQKMTDRYEGQTCNWAFLGENQALAQSFIPQKSILTKADLQIGLVSLWSVESNPMYVSIRENLTGKDIIITSVNTVDGGYLYMPNCFKNPWLTVDFPDTEVIPGKKYYMVARYLKSGTFSHWDHGGKFYFNDPDYHGDPYPSGDAYISYDGGRHWELHSPAHDFCFVTYGK